MFLRDYAKAATYEDYLELGFTEGFAQIFAEAFARGHERGFFKAGKNTVLILGRLRFGESAAADAQVTTITDQDRLDRVIDRLLDATGWGDLLSTP